jgi:putative transposase
MYHLIFVCKYRKHILTDLENIIKQKFYDISNDSDFKIIEMEVDKDHIHLLLSSNPKISILQIVRRLKQLSTSYLWHNYSDYLSKYFWKSKTFWSDGYFVCSIGNVSKDIIKKYIENQG